jgi:Flp pilus assembly pilin Flp
MAGVIQAVYRGARRCGRKLRRNTEGATAVEFAIISIPFAAIMFGLISVCEVYFWLYTSENAVWTASRDLRIGQVQTAAAGSVYSGLTGSALYTAFQQRICGYTVNSTDCMNNSVVLVQSNAVGFGSIGQPPSCIQSNALQTGAQAMAAFAPGASSSTVIVTLCYVWQAGVQLPFLPLPSTTGPNGSGYLIQASAVFKTEPY